MAAVVVALKQSRDARKAAALAQGDALQARQEAERDLLLREAQGAIQWVPQEITLFSAGTFDPLPIAEIRNSSARALYNFQAIMFVEGEQVGEAVNLGADRDGSGNIKAIDGTGQAVFSGIPHRNLNVFFRGTFTMDKYVFSIDEHNDVQVIGNVLSLSA